jgi:hypothetical protein
MYDYHLRKVNDKPNYGWLRNAYHSLIQQLVRQDPAYWLWYVLLRGDRNWKLISYPYYAKYQKPGDSTYFRHIDMNVPKLLAEGRGASLIQGSISLDNEDKSHRDCTMLLFGFDKKLGDWWKRISDRGKATDGLIHQIAPSMWTRDDIAHFGLDYTAQPCTALSVRISKPHLPHGADGPAETVRRTILPWFVGIGDDHEQLDISESGTWSQLSAAHRDMVPGPSSPSGHPNHFGKVPYAFPAAVPLRGLGHISDALVGRIKWTTPAVMNEVQLLLAREESDAADFIVEWREKAALAFEKAWAEVKELEQVAYGTKSYWKRTSTEPAAAVSSEVDPGIADHY